VQLLVTFVKHDGPIEGCESRKEGEGQTHGYQDSCGTLIKERRLRVAPGVFPSNPHGRRNDAGIIGSGEVVGNFGEL